MKAVYAGLLLGFAIASYTLSAGGHDRFILPLVVFAVAGVVAVKKDSY